MSNQPSDDIRPFIDDVVQQNVQRHYIRTQEKKDVQIKKDLTETLDRLCTKFYDQGYQNAEMLITMKRKESTWRAKIKRIFRKKQSTK